MLAAAGWVGWCLLVRHRDVVEIVRLVLIVGRFGKCGCVLKVCMMY